jgi:hypothetical protein
MRVFPVDISVSGEVSYKKAITVLELKKDFFKVCEWTKIPEKKLIQIATWVVHLREDGSWNLKRIPPKEEI